MKTIVPELSRSDAQELVAEQQKQYSLIGSVNRMPGLTLFEYDMTTGELRKADIDTSCVLQMDGGLSYRRKINQKALCLYVQALNEKNALKQVRRLLDRQTIRRNLLKLKKDG